MRASLVVIVLALATPAFAERGHQAYEEMVKRDQLRRLKARLDAAYSCKRRGTPLVRIEHAATSEDPATELVMYRGGAVQLHVGTEMLETCVSRRVNDWIRWRLANVKNRHRLDEIEAALMSALRA